MWVFVFQGNGVGIINVGLCGYVGYEGDGVGMLRNDVGILSMRVMVWICLDILVNVNII